VHANCVGNFSPAMGARYQVGIGLSYRPASLCSLATQCQTRFLESIPRPIAELNFSTLNSYYVLYLDERVGVAHSRDELGYEGLELALKVRRLDGVPQDIRK
jgi:hypothetical protein